MYFTVERLNRLVKELGDRIYPQSEKIGDLQIKRRGARAEPAGSLRRAGEGGFEGQAWEAFRPMDRWGGKDVYCRFRTRVAIPAAFAGKKTVFRVRTGNEGKWDATNPQFLVFIGGHPVQGMDVNHTEVLLSDSAKAGEVFDIELEGWSGMEEGLVEFNASILAVDTAAEKLYYDLKVPLDVASLLDENDKRRIDSLKLLNEAANLLDLRKPYSESYYSSLKAADGFLQTEFYDKFCSKDKYDGSDEVTALCVGHTHIDVAWLWTVAQTRDKTVRSFSTVLNLMKQYPGYVFMSSQPQLYKFIKEDFPELYGEMKKRIAEGRWEPEGAMWLEADCNLSSGEALVRQVLFGTRFFEKEFGIKNRILWLPDVFGYSAALPQILKKSGIDYFMTTKISWNEYNKMPYDSFMWRGIDGTEILTHFITTRDDRFLPNEYVTTYVGMLQPSQVKGAWDRYQHKGMTSQVLISYGYGDGGGGPTGEMLENAARLEKGIPGSPKVVLGRSLDFFKELERKALKEKRLPKWVGELYLEYHRGTYTSMARNKKSNRKSELLYQDAELMSAINTAALKAAYPREELNRGWEMILLNQFHDILPGSSIKQVYEDTKAQYETLAAEGNRLAGKAMAGVSSQIGLDSLSAVVFNQLSHTRSDIVELKLPTGWTGAELEDYGGKAVASQMTGSGSVIFFAENVPPKGYKAFRLKKGDGSGHGAAGPAAGAAGLSNRYFEISLDEACNITSIYDRQNDREVLKAGARGNVLQAFEDKPHNYDAWDINIYYQEKTWEVTDVQSAGVVESGPVRTGLLIKRKFLDSTIEQIIYIYRDIPRIDFVNTIDWKEKQILLKSYFPVDVHTDKATYDIQYGNVERPTHWNTSWDYARFEVCAHKWADLSEDGFGVSLLNDCKYGHDIKDGVMRLTLLKSAVSPNEDADREVHRFTYSLYPHGGDWREAGTVGMAYALNCPMYARLEEAHKGGLPAEFSFVGSDSENVVIEAVKLAEDSGDFIVRVYECYNRRTDCSLSFFKELFEVMECDMLENDQRQLVFDKERLDFTIQPYEIKTLKVRFK